MILDVQLRFSHMIMTYIATLYKEILFYLPYCLDRVSYGYRLLRSIVRVLVYQRFHSHDKIKKLFQISFFNTEIVRKIEKLR